MSMHSKVNSTYLTEKGRQLLPNKNKVHRANNELKTQIHTPEASKRGEIRKLQVTDGTTERQAKHRHTPSPMIGSSSSIELLNRSLRCLAQIPPQLEQRQKLESSNTIQGNARQQSNTSLASYSPTRPIGPPEKPNFPEHANK